MRARETGAHQRAAKPVTGHVENRMTRERAGSEAGFSLVELLVAMTITLIISGAIYGLLSGGQSAFRREPELTDRQQNARIAMSLIMRDIANAGSGMPPFVQTFTRNLDGPSAAPLNAGNVATDEIEMITNTGARDNEPVCNNSGGSPVVRLLRAVDAASIPDNTVVLLLMADGTYALRNINTFQNNNGGPGTCQSGMPGHGTPVFQQGGDPTGLNKPGGVCVNNGVDTNTDPNCVVVALSFATLVHYRIRNDASGVPVLQRFSSDDPAAFLGGAVSNNGFQTVARGIEDLQIQYTNSGAPTTWVNGAPAVVQNDYTTLINQVRVTLVARSEARNIQGARTSASGRVNIRGSLTSIGTPRSTLIQLANAPVASPAPHPWF
jgi:prepilin-type N-terminal cleavage/methylation domain-containing protein